MSKPKRQKQTAIPKMHERTIVFAFNAKAHMTALNTLLATLQDRIYSTHADLVLSPDGTLAKIVIKANIAQMNNLDGFLRNVPGVKILSDNPNADLVDLIKCYHRHLWGELLCPHEEMHLSVFVGGLAMRQALLDCPDWEPQPDLWKLGEACYQALTESHLFGDLAAMRSMILYSFVGGYLAEQGTCKLALESGDMAETVKLKAQVLLTEEEGRPDIIIHTMVLHMRDRLIALGKRNVMELLISLESQG